MTTNSIICYIGGGKILEPSCIEIINELKQLVTSNKYTSGAVIVASEAKKDTWIKVGQELLNELGLKKTSVFNPHESDFLSSWEDLEKAELIFVTGGLPDTLLLKLKKIGLLDKIAKILSNNSKLVIGISAGALIFNNVCFISKDEDYPTEIFMKGLSLKSDFICEVHYESARFDYIKNALARNNVIAIEENSALFYYPTGEKLSVGKIHFFEKNM